MLIKDLQRLIGDLSQFLQGAAAKSVTGELKSVSSDLTRMADSLTPFAHQSVSEFSDFLAMADEYRRTGAVSTAKKTKQGPAVDQDAIAKLAQEILDKCESAMSFEVSHADIFRYIQSIKKTSAPQLKAVAKELGIPVNSKSTKDDLLKEIESLISGGKRTHAQISTITG